MFDLNDICAADRRMQRHDDDGWVTINGTHVMVSGGKATGGACGSKLSGYDFSSAKSAKSKGSSVSKNGKKITSLNGIKAGDRIHQTTTDYEGKHEKEFTVTEVDKEKGQVYGKTDDGVGAYMDKYSFSGGETFSKIGEASNKSKKTYGYAKGSKYEHKLIK